MGLPLEGVEGMGSSQAKNQPPAPLALERFTGNSYAFPCWFMRGRLERIAPPPPPRARFAPSLPSPAGTAERHPPPGAPYRWTDRHRRRVPAGAAARSSRYFSGSPRAWGRFSGAPPRASATSSRRAVARPATRVTSPATAPAASASEPVPLPPPRVRGRSRRSWSLPFEGLDALCPEGCLGERARRCSGAIRLQPKRSGPLSPS